MSLGSGIRDPGSRGQKCTGSRIPDPDPQHCYQADILVRVPAFLRDMENEPAPSKSGSDVVDASARWVWRVQKQCFGSGFIWFRIRIQHFRLNTHPDPIRIQGDEQNWKNLAIYLSLGLYTGQTSYRRSLQPSKENIQHFKTWNFLPFFYFVGLFCPPRSGFRIRIRIHWPDWIRIRGHFCHCYTSLVGKSFYNITLCRCKNP